MSGFVEEVRPIGDCLQIVSEALAFPWDVERRSLPLEEAVFLRAADDIRAKESVPPFTRSLRDGYALGHANTVGASSGAPVFLRLGGEVEMGCVPDFALGPDEVAAIPTGGMIPEGADAVVMLEDTAEAGGWIEIRKSVQRGESLIFAGEDIAEGDVLLRRGERIGAGLPGLLSSLGITRVDVADVKIGVISTGDEIVPADTPSPAPGTIRDANAYIVQSTLKQYGFSSRPYGIVPDEKERLASRVREALSACDVVLLSGGSSVGARDHTAGIMESLDHPGLLVRGINMAPGKPTLIGGSLERKKLLMGLPGHPLSCMVATLFVVLPLLLRMCGAREETAGRWMKARLAEDVMGRTGPDEFVPMRLADGLARPLAAKSGYVSAMRDADGFIRMHPNTETLRKGEEADIWIW